MHLQQLFDYLDIGECSSNADCDGNAICDSEYKDCVCNGDLIGIGTNEADPNCCEYIFA